MQPLKQLSETLRSLAGRQHCLFAASDLAAAVPGNAQLAVLLSRTLPAQRELGQGVMPMVMKAFVHCDTLKAECCAEARVVASKLTATLL